MRSELDKNYFELFGIPPQFTVDLPDLATRYRELQKKFHPDKFASSTDAERRMASQMAAQINAAYQSLKSPLERGRYLLKLAGIVLDDEKDTQMNPAFLMEQMEFREQFESASGAEDPLSHLLELGREINRAIDSRISRLEDLFQGKSSESLSQARNLLREMQFLEKLRKDIDRKEDELV
ncbi:MAG: Fe-S protein assembly co-chaperone HscB [Acidiferrobacterales bacterium]